MSKDFAVVIETFQPWPERWTSQQNNQSTVWQCCLILVKYTRDVFISVIVCDLPLAFYTHDFPQVSLSKSLILYQLMRAGNHLISMHSGCAGEFPSRWYRVWCYFSDTWIMYSSLIDLFHRHLKKSSAEQEQQIGHAQQAHRRGLEPCHYKKPDSEPIFSCSPSIHSRLKCAEVGNLVAMSLTPSHFH